MTDVATETNDERLLQSGKKRWDDMAAVSPARTRGTIDPKLFGGNARAPGPVRLRRPV